MFEFDEVFDPVAKAVGELREEMTKFFLNYLRTVPLENVRASMLEVIRKFVKENESSTSFSEDACINDMELPF